MSDLEQRLVDALLAEVKGEPAPLALAFARGVARTVEPVLAAEVAALRAKAAAADRVEELADELDTRARAIAQEADEMADSFRRSGMLGRLLGMKAAAARIRIALDGPAVQQ